VRKKCLFSASVEVAIIFIGKNFLQLRDLLSTVY